MDRNGEVAVEISTLAQYIRDEHGENARMSYDMPPLRLADDLNGDLYHQVPDDSHFVLVLTSPLNAPRKTKDALLRNADFIDIGFDSFCNLKASICGC